MFTILLLAVLAVLAFVFRKQIAAFFASPPDILAEAEDAVKSELDPPAKPSPATGAATPTGPPKT